jgi:putative transposase
MSRKGVAMIRSARSGTTMFRMRGLLTPHSRDLRKGRVSQRGRVYLVTIRSAVRRPLFTDLDLGQIVIDEIHQSDLSNSTRTFAFVVMPDHVHWLFELSGDKSLSQVVRYLKGHSSHRINKAQKITVAVWQAGFHDRALRRMERLRDVAYYIINNPVRAGLIKEYSDYPMLFADSL